MAKFDKLAVMQKIGETGMVPVFYHSNAETAKKVIKACYDGGVRAFEFTNRGDFAQEVFAECVKFAAKECPELALGIGSVVDAPDGCPLYSVGSLLRSRTAVQSRHRTGMQPPFVPYCPGCGTVSEIGKAQELGCDLCKLFPGDVYGPAFVKGMMAPCPWTKLMVTGGVAPTKENLTAWVKAGVYCVGMGSKLFPKEEVAAGNWQYITDKCKEALGYIAEARV